MSAAAASAPAGANLTVVAPASPTARLSGSSPRKNQSPRKQPTSPAGVPGVASVRMLSPKERRLALAESDKKREAVVAAQAAKLEAARLAGMERSTEQKKKFLAHKAEEDKVQKMRFAQSMAQIRAEAKAQEEKRAAASAKPAVAKNNGIKLGLKVVESGKVSGPIGVKVLDVERDSAAWLATIEENDVIKAVNGFVVQGQESFDKIVANLRPNTSASFQLWREGFLVNVQVTCKVAVGGLDDAVTPENEPADQ
jgi:predicted metalloprotease with PDZ domain